MRLSHRARYALRMMLAIARLSPDEGRVSLQKVSRHTGISYRYLEQLALVLRQAGLISGMPGKNGGYLLARLPEDIRLDEIFQAAIGPIRIVECLDNPGSCRQVETCECRDVYIKINEGIVKVLRSFTLRNLLR